jgi:hypothetical protein
MEVDLGGGSTEDGHAGAVHEDGPSCDPILRALTRGGDPKTLKLFAGSQAELDSKATEAERALRRRADATKAALAQLLQRTYLERQRFESRLADAAPAETAEELRRFASTPSLDVFSLWMTVSASGQVTDSNAHTPRAFSVQHGTIRPPLC